jgi:hypothetical protein
MIYDFKATPREEKRKLKNRYIQHSKSNLNFNSLVPDIPNTLLFPPSGFPD